MSQDKGQQVKHQEYAKELEGVSLKKMIIKNLKNVMECLDVVISEEKKEEHRKELASEKHSQMTTERT